MPKSLAKSERLARLHAFLDTHISLLPQPKHFSHQDLLGSAIAITETKTVANRSVFVSTFMAAMLVAWGAVQCARYTSF